MSKERKTVEQSRAKLAVEINDVIRFLEEKSLDSECPACGTDEWTIVCPADPEGALDTYRLVTPLRDGDRPMTLSTVAIYCDNCGFVRQHLSRLIKKWIVDNPLEPELDFDEGLNEKLSDE